MTESKPAIAANVRKLVDDLRHAMASSPADRRAVLTLIVAGVLLVVFGLWGRPGFLKGPNLETAAAVVGLDPGSEYYRLLRFLYWGVTSLLERALRHRIRRIGLARDRSSIAQPRSAGTLF